jgi:hypothetical protein
MQQRRNQWQQPRRALAMCCTTHLLQQRPRDSGSYLETPLSQNYGFAARARAYFGGSRTEQHKTKQNGTDRTEQSRKSKYNEIKRVQVKPEMWTNVSISPTAVWGNHTFHQ